MNKKILYALPVLAIVSWFIYQAQDAQKPTDVELVTQAPTNTPSEKPTPTSGLPTTAKDLISTIPASEDWRKNLSITDIERLAELAQENKRFDRYVKEGYGKFKAVDLTNPTPQLTSVIEALKNPGSHPERLSHNAKIPAFNEQVYLADPAAYVAQHVPARAWQSAQPDTGAQPMERISPYYSKTTQDSSVNIAVRIAQPGMPVTFTTVSGGSFVGSRLMSITVIAGADGVAQADFIPGPGVIEDCPIFCSSPVALRTLRFVVDARLPEAVENP